MIDKPFGEMKVGDSKISTGRTITETDIVNFAMFMGSWLELQTNDEFAQHTVYGKRIAQGPMVYTICLLYTSPSPRDATLSRMPSSA